MKPLVSISIVTEYRLEIFEMPYMEIFQIAQIAENQSLDFLIHSTSEQKVNFLCNF